MAASRAESLIQDYVGNTQFIRQLSDGLSHQETMIQPDFDANCFNWVLGHIVWRRNVVLEVLEHAPLWSEALAGVYMSGSPPLRSGESARDISQLLEDLLTTTELIRLSLEGAPETYLDELVVTDRGEKSRFKQLTGFHWHETFHLGQLDLLRALALSRRT